MLRGLSGSEFHDDFEVSRRLLVKGLFSECRRITSIRQTACLVVNPVAPGCLGA